MKYLEIKTSSYSEDEDRELDPDDSWDRLSSSTTWSVHGLKLLDEEAYQALPCPDDFKSGDKLFCLWVQYSSGDSFGHDAGAQFEFISYHKTSELAAENESIITSGGNEITLDNGEKQTVYRSWDGYFESLDSANVSELEIE